MLDGAEGSAANDTTSTLTSGISTSEVVHIFDEDSLRTAADNFSDDNKVDEGTFGVVYVGTLSRQVDAALNGVKVAIKVLKFKADPKKNRDGEKGFEKEVQVLGKYSHPNVVRLYGRGKALLQSSHHYHDAKTHFADHGIQFSGEVTMDVGKMQDAKVETVKGLTGGIEHVS